MIANILRVILIFAIINCSGITHSQITQSKSVTYYMPEGMTDNPNRIFYDEMYISYEFSNFEDDLNYLEALKNEILLLTKNKRSSDLRQCGFIAIGYNTCGENIEEYILFSHDNTDLEGLISKAQYYRSYCKYFKGHYNLIDNCLGITQPNVSIVSGECSSFYD